MKYQVNFRNLLIGKKRVLLLLTFLASITVMAQNSDYRVINTETTTNSDVKIRMVVYCKDKKAVDSEAQIAALRVALFDGCPNTQYAKPLLEDGQRTSVQKYSYYFDDLFNYRFPDFISSFNSLSKFKKGDTKKGTEYEITVKALSLRKDLEKNKIKRKFGL